MHTQTRTPAASGALAWEPGELEVQLKAGAWITAAASRPLLLKQVRGAAGKAAVGCVCWYLCKTSAVHESRLTFENYTAAAAAQAAAA